MKESEIDIMKLKEAAKLAEIDSFIEQECTNKYETIVGENAIKLRGSKQRIE